MTDKDAEDNGASRREEAREDTGIRAGASARPLKAAKRTPGWSLLGPAYNLGSAIPARIERFIEPIGRLRVQLKPRQPSDLLTLKADEGDTRALNWAERAVYSATSLVSGILCKFDQDADVQLEWPGLAYARPPEQSRLRLTTWLRHRLAGYGRRLGSSLDDKGDSASDTAGPDEDHTPAFGWTEPPIMQAPVSTVGEEGQLPPGEMQQEMPGASAKMPATISGPPHKRLSVAGIGQGTVGMAQKTTGLSLAAAQLTGTELAPPENPEEDGTLETQQVRKRPPQPLSHGVAVKVAGQSSEPTRDLLDSGVRHVYCKRAAESPQASAERASSVESGASQAGLPSHLERLPQLPTAESRMEELPPQSAASFPKARLSSWQKDMPAEKDQTGIGFDARTYGDEKTLAAMNITSLRGHSETVLRLSDDILQRYGTGQKGRKSSGIGGGFIDAFASQPDREPIASRIGLPDIEPEFEPGLRHHVGKPHDSLAEHIVQRLRRESTAPWEKDEFQEHIQDDFGYMLEGIRRSDELPHAVLAAPLSRETSPSLTVAKASADRPTTSGTVTPPSAEAAAEVSRVEQTGLDVDALARQVYRIITSRLALEKERHAFSV